MSNFNEIKDVAKKVAVDTENINRLYIEKLESPHLFDNVEEFNILYIVKDFIEYDLVLEIAEKFGDVSVVFEGKSAINFEEYRVLYDNFVQGTFRFVKTEDKEIYESFEDKYICVLNKESEKEIDVLLNENIKITEDEFLYNCCEFFWSALKISRKLAKKELLSTSFEFRKMMEILDIHLKHYVLSENKYLLDLGKDNKFIFNYLDTEFFEKYLQCYSKLDLGSKWDCLFTMCVLFRKISLKIAVNLRFEYPKELDRDIIGHVREIRSSAM